MYGICMRRIHMYGICMRRIHMRGICMRRIHHSPYFAQAAEKLSPSSKNIVSPSLSDQKK